MAADPPANCRVTDADPPLERSIPESESGRIPREPAPRRLVQAMEEGAMTASSASPAPERGRALHARLLAGDPVAPADPAEAYLDPLATWLARQNPGVTDPHLCTVAAGEAIIALIAAPGSYDPTRRSLAGYLRMSAQGDLRNLLRTERRHAARRASLEAVELSPRAGKELWDVESDPARIVERAIVEREAELTVDSLPSLPGLTPQETAVLALLRQGERRTIAYARLLGLDRLPVAEQRREVKRVKDRLQKRLMRAGGRDG